MSVHFSYKKVLLLFFIACGSLSLFAQIPKPNDMQNYTKYWKAINTLESQGKTKTALETSENLYEKIKTDTKNPYQSAQLIKVLIYTNKYKAQLEEDGLVKAIYRIESAAKACEKEEEKAILFSILAEVYDQYLMYNLNRFRNRTEVLTYDSKDIRTWDVAKITTRCYELHNKAISLEKTKAIPLSQYAPITNDLNQSGDTHPTVYDFLVHRAIEFFKSEKYYLHQPTFKFYIEEKEALESSKTFISHKFRAKDSLSNQFQTLLCFQQLLKFHLEDKDPKAFIHTELKRLKYVRSKAILVDKEVAYYSRLEELFKKYKDNSAAAEILHHMAQYHHEKGKGYQPSALQTNRWELKKAIELCEKAIKDYPDSYGSQLAKHLQQNIRTKDIEVSVEKIYPQHESMLASIAYRNVGKVYLKLIKLSDEERIKYRDNYGRKRVEYVNKLNVIRQWELELKNEGDYQTHRSEFSIKGLPSGQYVLVASEQADFKYNENGQAYNLFYVSDLAYLSRQEGGLIHYYVTDRKTGKALKGVEVNFYKQKRNRFFKNTDWRKINTLTTDANGLVITPSLKQSKSETYKITLKYKKNTLRLDETDYNYEIPKNDRTNHKTHFFLDRAIYRPGQTVYFKGIIIKTKGTDHKNPEIVPNKSTIVRLYDANAQEVAQVKVKTNEYGSYQGSFTAPNNGMMGQMKIVDDFSRNNHYFSVEEYKRPKFEVSFKPITGSFKLGEKVSVTGLAKAYAGNPIDGAKVSYRVIRKTSFPYWPWWRLGWYNPYNTEQQEIKFGELKSDKNGEFVIEFDAIADNTIPKKQQPQFTYTIHAVVVDITGETHDKEIHVEVGHVALLASVNIGERVQQGKAETFEISTQNLNGEFEAAQGRILIEQLATPKQTYKERYWSLPDYPLMTPAQFKKQFGAYAFANEDAVQQWPVVKTVLDEKFDTKNTKELKIDSKKWPQARYKLTLKTKDKFGTAIEKVQYFELYATAAKTTPSNQALFLAKNAFSGLEVGSKVSLDIGSFNKKAWILVEIEKDHQIVKRTWYQPKGRKQIEIPINEEDRGNFHFHISSVQNNRCYRNGGTFYVPYKNKQLKFEYITFRDKLYPGQDEEWRIKVSGLKKDKVAAELLVGMYDASLDAFRKNHWALDLYPSNYKTLDLDTRRNFSAKNSSLLQYKWNVSTKLPIKHDPTLNWFGFGLTPYADYEYSGGVVRTMSERTSENTLPLPRPGKMKKLGRVYNEDITDRITTQQDKLNNTDQNGDFGNVNIRTNLKETVFFFPQLMTDDNGAVIIKFKMNEALTKWKFMALAHSKDLKIKTDYKEVITQKDLMIVPNAPRFFRQGDTLHFGAKISNLTAQEMSGQATLQLFDANSMKSIDVAFGNKGRQDFTVGGGQSSPLSWKLEIPKDWSSAITYRVVAKAGNFSDGEENSLMVLTNQILLTETQPLAVRGGEKKNFEFKRIQELSSSSTLQHHKYTLEFTQNPAWYAVQALPYLMEYPYECTEQIFSRYYANSLATQVANAHPKIKKVFEQWKNIRPEALKSNLSKNQEFKSALLEETPWVLNAESEEQQKKNLGLLFDLNRMAMEQEQSQKKIADRQLSNGGFSWFPGGRDNWYITQYLVEGFGHLDQLGVSQMTKNSKMASVLERAIDYCDNQLAKTYLDLQKYAKRQAKEDKGMPEAEYLALDHLNAMAIHYLYSRSFFLDQPIKNNTTKKAISYYTKQAKNYWIKKSMYMKGLLALALHRQGKDKETPQNIVTFLKENALHHQEMGMYWKYPSGYFWHQAPIETHALMIEVFDVIGKDPKIVDELKVWLLKNKQTSHWKTTKATASAVYALLARGDNWLTDDQELTIYIGGQKLDQSKIKKSAGTGYFKTTWEGTEITNKMANIRVENPNNVAAWGAVYWQYFEELDKVTHFEETPLKLDKKLFKQINTDRGPKLVSIEDPKVKLEVGDLLKVRIEIRVDRDMEYVHLKDQRASGFEPENVLSQYKYQGGLGYYESTRDAATHFFFDYLSKGTYVFEYPLRVNQKGSFSNGVTSIQCMYAPEFTSHSEGIRVEVE